MKIEHYELSRELCAVKEFLNSFDPFLAKIARKRIDECFHDPNILRFLSKSDLYFKIFIRNSNYGSQQEILLLNLEDKSEEEVITEYREKFASCILNNDLYDIDIGICGSACENFETILDTICIW